jgi:multidrug efflux pump subunit AcrA (membrane-fusion protein)
MTAARRRLVRGAAFAALALVIVLSAAGVFERGRVAPGRAPAVEGLPAPARTAVAVRARVPVVEEAVGTVDSRRRVDVAAEIVARVRRVAARAGDRIAAGALLVALDDAEAAARYARASAQYERVKGFLARQAATREQMEAATAEYAAAKAGLEHTRLTAPIAGVVAERRVEPGDLATPGRVLLVVLDPAALRLEARVREAAIAHVTPGATLEVVFPSAAAVVQGTVAEVLPAADPQSRTFTVRVDVPAEAGIRPGMFGRVRLPVGEREVVHVPAAAVTRTGQLETVVVAEDGVWLRRFVTTGGAVGDGSVEILSGLAGGETIALPADA